MNLNQITIPSKDLTQSIPFYEKLGLQLIVQALPDYARFVCPDGNSSFSIHRTDHLPTGDGIYVYFECDELDEYVAQLIEKGIEFDQQPTDQPWLWREARLKDPDDNQLILYYGGENRLNPPWRVAATPHAHQNIQKMEQRKLSELTDQELLAEAKKRKAVSVQYALMIGFLIGIVIYSVVENTLGFFTLIPLYFIYRLIDSPDHDAKELKSLLKERNLR